MKSRRRRNRGFSILEVLFAIFMVASAASMFYAIMPAAARTGKMVGNYQQAASLVQHKIDQLRGVGYGRLTYTELKAAGIIDSSPNSSPYRFTAVDNLSSIYPNPVGTITVSDFNSSIKRVDVTLTWTGSAARAGNGTLSTSALIAKG